MKKVVVLDGNNVFRDIFEGVYQSKGHEEAAKFNFNRAFGMKLSKIAGMYDFTSIVFDSSEKCFRYDIYDGYKAGRKNDEIKKGLWREVLKKWQKRLKMKKIPFIVVDGLEADDVIATLSKKYNSSYDISIASIDKDMYQLLDENVSILNFRTNTVITDSNIDYNMAVYKILCGDKSDSIGGVKGLSKNTGLSIAKKFSPNVEVHLNEILKYLNDTTQETIERITRNYNLIVLQEHPGIPFKKIKSSDLKFI